MRMGGSGSGGDLFLFGPDDARTDDATATIHLEGSSGNLRMGGGGVDGDIFLFAAGDVRTNDATATIHLEGETANLRMGGGGTDADLYLFAADGDRSDSATATVHLSAGTANLRMGGGGVDGDIFLFPSGGNRNDDDTATIHLDADRGDILLRNADCAEDFDVADIAAVQPGVVVVLDEDGRVMPCAAAYDARVAGVVSGAGHFQPGIVLDKQRSDRPRRPVALMGKVYCRVDASYAPVVPGDMLTTSPTQGHAMKAIDRERAFGAVLGKALKPLPRGCGLVPILVTLQ
jgi:hypothetical protein